MGINRQDSRHRIKRSNLTGVVPTAHTASTDFTDGTWLNTDLREAEFFYNIPDKKLWIGTGTSSIEIAQIGSTTSGNSLAQTLAIGNDSGANNIIMGTGTNIHTSQGTGGLSLDITGPQSVYLGDNMTATANYLWLRDGNFLRLRANNNHIELAAQSTTIGIGDTYDGIVLSPNTGLSTHIHYGGSEILSVTGSGIVMQSATVIKSANGRSQIDLDFGFTQDNILLSSDNGGQAESYVFLDPATVFIKNGDGGTGRSFLQLDGNVKLSTIDIFSTDGKFNTSNARNIIFFGDSGAAAVTTQNNDKPGVVISSKNSTIDVGVMNSVILGSDGITATQSNSVYVPDLMIQTGKGIKFDYTTLTTGSVSTTTIGTFSMANITFMANDQSFSIRGHANGYCASPNRNMGATFYASFLKYGGTIYQNGTTDIVLKDGYGDGTTPAVWTDGTNIYISVRTFSALTSTFTTSYEILV